MIIIRNLEKEDAGQVALLIGQLTLNIIDPGTLVKRIEQLPKSSNSQFLVAKEHGNVVGVGGLAWYVIPSKGLIGWIEELVVDHEYRGRGIGRTIMEKLLRSAKQKNIKQLKLTSTPMAKGLYDKLGFVKKDQDYLVKNLW